MLFSAIKAAPTTVPAALPPRWSTDAGPQVPGGRAYYYDKSGMYYDTTGHGRYHFMYDPAIFYGAEEAAHFACTPDTCRAVDTAAREQGIFLGTAINAAARVLGVQLRAPEEGDITATTLKTAQAIVDAKPILPKSAQQNVVEMLAALRARRITLEDFTRNTSEKALAFLFIAAHARPTPPAGTSPAMFVALGVAGIVIIGGLFVMLSGPRHAQLPP